MRDGADAAPLARLRHGYWTPRCVQRESIARVGIGVSAGLDALVVTAHAGSLDAMIAACRSVRAK